MYLVIVLLPAKARGEYLPEEKEKFPASAGSLRRG